MKTHKFHSSPTYRFSSVFVAAALLLLAVLFNPGVSLAQVGTLAYCNVTSTADSGAGTLRQCLLTAANGDTIRFHPTVFPPGAPATISLASALPDLTQGNLTIDASNAGVILDGSGTPGGTNGLNIPSEGNRVMGLQILYFPNDGVYVTGSNNIIGGDQTIGSGPLGEGNLVSGNGGNGVVIVGASAAGNIVSGNYIGVDVSGEVALPNGGNGVWIGDSASNNLIGGEDEGERNLIFSNRYSGVSISDSGTTDNVVQGNWIGLSASGAARQAFPADMAISPDYPNDCTLFVATLSTGVHRSTDCGASWAEINNGLSESRFLQIVIPPDAADANTVYALAENGYLFVTYDGGDNWSLLSTALEGIDRRNLVLSADFANDQTMYASAENWSWGEYGGEPGVFKSSDGGLSWERKSSGMGDNHVWKVIASPDLTEKDTLFALTWGGIQKTIDGGENWFVLPEPDSNLSDLALSPAYASDQTLFVTSNNGRVYWSTDGGWSWDGVDALRGDPRFLALSPDFPNDQMVCHGGGWNDAIYCSTDGGYNWTQTDTKLPAPLGNAATGIAFSPDFVSDNTMFVLSYAGMSQSTDGGATWALVRALRDLGNQQGVSLRDGASNNVIGPDNVISNNDLGVTIDSDSTAENVIAGNLIGVDPSGTIGLGNPEHAVGIWGGHDNLIGGDTPEARNVINGSLSAGAVWLNGPGVVSNIVSGNYIGVDITGATIIGNYSEGVALLNGASYNVIGGETEGERNIISGNGTGVGIWDPGTQNNVVSGNYIGVDVSGGLALGNRWQGVGLWNSASYNLIGGDNATPGGPCSGECNLISGNEGSGVYIDGSETMSNTVSGNYVGTDVTGTAAIGNYGNIIHMGGDAAYNTIGGDTPEERNVISGNDGHGVVVNNGHHNTIIGNYIGVDATGAGALGNNGAGVGIAGAQNIIGGDSPEAWNLIANNGWVGIYLHWDTTDENQVLGNQIEYNSAHGIELMGDGSNGPQHNLISGAVIHDNGGDGISVRDAPLFNTITQNSIYSNAGRGIDLVNGGNAELPAPYILSVDLPGGVVTGTACVDCTVEVFSDNADEGRIYEGATTADAIGVWTLLAGHPLAGPNIAATATDAAGNTSEFGGLTPLPLHIFIYDDYEEDSYEGSLRQYLEARGHSVTYSHDNVGDIDVWESYSDYDIVLAIHTVGGGTLTNLPTWFQNGRGYVAMLGGGMWNDDDDAYIRDLLGVNESGEVGCCWTPDQLFWADAGHPIAYDPNDGWDITGVPAGQDQFYIDIIDGYTVVAAPDGNVLQTREGVEGAARLVVFGSNFHDQDRTDAEGRALVENALMWAANPQATAWFHPSDLSQKGSPGATVSYTLRLVNRSGQEATFDLAISGNAWPTSFWDESGNPISSVGPLPNWGGANLVVRVEIPAEVGTDESDTAALTATAQHDPSLIASAETHTFAPGPAYNVILLVDPYNVPASGAATVTATVTDRDGFPVVDGVMVDFSVTTGGSVDPLSSSTSGGVATTTFTGGAGCALAEIQASSGAGWDSTYVSVDTAGPTDLSGGEIGADTTWTACAGPYRIHGDLTVNPGVTLTVEAATQVRFDEDTGLFVLGTLNAVGTSDAHVLFTANDSNPWRGYWKGLILGDDANAASGQLEYVTVSYAGRWHTWGEGGSVAQAASQPSSQNRAANRFIRPEQSSDFAAGVLIYNGAPTIAHSLIYHNQGDGIWAAPNSLPTISDNRILDNEGGVAVASVKLAAIDTPIPAGTEADVWWRYTAFEEPPAGWNTDPNFDDSGWNEGLTPICDWDECKTYLDLEGGTMYARKVITPTFPLTTTYYLRANRDDMVSVWVNGTLVFSDTQGGGAMWTPYIPVSLDPGANLIAAEMRDSGWGANYFDLELIGGEWRQPLISANLIRRNGFSGWAGIYIWNSSPMVIGNQIAENYNEGVTIGSDSWPEIRNNLIHRNSSNGIYFGYSWPGDGPSIFNNTVDANGNYGIRSDGNAQPTVQNNIVTRNGGGGLSCWYGHLAEIGYNDAWGNSTDFEGCEWTPESFSYDPFYVDAEAADYHLQLGSRAIDAGNPDPAFNDLDGTRNDMGAYGGPDGESYTYQDLRGPAADWATVDPPAVPPGETVTLNAFVWDPSGITWVNAEIESPDETVIETLPLYDDGAHNDGDPGDGVFGNTWTTPAGEATYFVDILSEDGLGQASLYDNMTTFRAREPITLIVTSVADDGPGTLRQAMLDAQYGDTITFDPTVFPPDGPQTWDGWDNYVVHTSALLFDEGVYKMWYAGWGTGSFWPGAIGYAASPDGIAWTKPFDAPLLNGTPGSWDEGGVEQPHVLPDNGEYRMWYGGRNSDGVMQIGYATSPDGIQWTKYAGNPVLTVGAPGEWDEGGVNAPFVLWTDDHYTMWYQGVNADGISRIGVATSPDGLSWTKHGGNPIFEVGDPGDWDEFSVADPNLVWDGGQYHLWYAGGQSMWGSLQIGHATSLDGILWTRDINNPVVGLGATDAWDDYIVSEPNVLLEGMTFKMWFSGNDSERWNKGYAWSADGSAWEKYAENPVLVSSPPETFILLYSPLPDINQGNLTIDASDAGVVLDGSYLNGGSGLHLTSNGNVIQGLLILSFPDHGIQIDSGASYNLIGGDRGLGSGPLGQGNLISNNGSNGIGMWNADASFNTIQGNYIGTDLSGASAFGNRADGVHINGPHDNQILDNLIGGNENQGISLNDAAQNIVNGNLIFSNLNSGVNLWGSGTVSNTLSDNYIGLGLDEIRQAFPADMAISPDYANDCTLFVATLSTGVHKSTDCGESWFEVNNGLSESRLMQVEIPPDATNADTLYAFAENGYLFVTYDGGGSWSLLSTALENIDRRNLVLSADFTNDQTMYASAEWWSNCEFYGCDPGVFRSTDGGLSWERKSSGMGDNHVWKVIASPDPAEKDTLFALTWGGIQKSIDGGESWSNLPAPDCCWRDLALSPAYASDQTLFVVTDTSWVYWSNDGGWNWNGVPALRGDPRFLALSPDFPNDHTVCHGGGWNDWIYCSTDGGANWTQAETGLRGGLADVGTGIAFSPGYSSDKTMFILSVAGMSTSADGGTTWEVLRGLHDLGNADGVWVGGGASYNTIGPDNVISNNFFGVSVNDADTAYNVIAGNFIGVDPTGMFAQSNVDNNVAINAGHHNLIGGDSPDERNIISGNIWGETIRLNGAETLSNTVSGNYIGTDVTGAAIIGNSGSGVAIHSGAKYNLIGGDTPEERNIISGNGTGVALWDADTRDNIVSGNYIGTDVSGTVALGNRYSGVGLWSGASYNTIGGDTEGERNVISGNGRGVGMWNADTQYNTVSGNYIGVDASGAAPLGNQRQGVEISDGASYNTIGGDTEGERNIISANGDQGVGMWGSDTSYNIIQGNFIGTDASGTVALGNYYAGIHINGPHDNQILDNLISANGSSGVELCCTSDTSYNTVTGNFIGSDASGTSALGNNNEGVDISGGAHDNVIGGLNPGEGNLISGNGGDGIGMRDGGTSNNTIAGNFIGTDASGAQPLANGWRSSETLKVSEHRGVSAPISCAPSENYPPEQIGQIANLPHMEIECSSSPANPTSQPEAIQSQAEAEAIQSNGWDGVYIAWGASQNTIGPGNVIAFNTAHGVEVQGGDALGNTITQNSIFRNDGWGIALTDGGNADLAAPHIDQIDLPGGVVSGTACADCTIEVFSADDEEGKTYEGATTADGSGNWTLNAGHPLTGPFVTATATDAGQSHALAHGIAGNTSEFSALFDLLWVDLGPDYTAWTLDRIGIPYSRVDVWDFGSVNLDDYDVLFVGSVNEGVPDNIFQPLVDRKADIATFVQSGGGLVALSEGGDWSQYWTSLAWQWTPITLTVDLNAVTRRTHILTPTHTLVEGLTDASFNYWWGAHGEPFTAWDWPEATNIVMASLEERSALLAGPYGNGRMALSGQFPDTDSDGDPVLKALLFWAADRTLDAPPQVSQVYPEPNGWAATNTRLRLIFDQLLDPATVTDGVLSVIADSGAVSGAFTFLPDTSQIFFTPDLPLTAGEQVTATLSAAVTDVSGNPLDGNEDGVGGDPFVWRFTVRAGETIIVTSPANEGPGTLREAIDNALPGDTITFDPAVFPPVAPTTIYPEWELSVLWQGYVTVDASDAGVIIDNSDGGWAGFSIPSDGNVLQGLTIINASDTGLWIGNGAAYNLIGGDRTIGLGPNGQGNTVSNNGSWGVMVQHTALYNTFRGNHVGADSSGTVAWPNGYNWGGSGLYIEQGSDYTVIENNLISGNNGDGLDINESYSVTVTNNLLGTDVSGMAALPNGDCGLDLQGGSRYSTFSGNVFSGNGFCGVQTDDPGTGYNDFVNNYFGVNAAGTDRIPNGIGLFVFDHVEGTLVEDNVFANTYVGIYAMGSNNVYRGNFIGTDATETLDWGHQDAALAIYGWQGGETSWESRDNLIENNVVANNSQGIILVSWYGALVEGNTITQNSLYNNDDGGIELYGGANANILPPIVTTSNPAAGTAEGTACPNCTIEVFSDDEDEGRWYEGTTTVDAIGDWSFDKGSPFTGSNIHATATDAGGNTSEFSGPPPVISGVEPNTATPGTVDLGVTLNGDYFRDNSPLTVDFGADITITAIEFYSRTQIKVYLDVDPGAAYGLRDVTVTNYDGQSVVLTNGFEVVPVPPPPPIVTHLVPNQAVAGVTSNMYVHGTGFIDRPRVSFSGGDVTVNSVTFNNATRLVINISVNPAAPLGARDITLTNPDGQSHTLVGALTIVTPIFSDVAPSLGLDVSSGEHGAAWGDQNGDGWLDLAIGDGTLFTNTLGTAFTDATTAAGLDDIGYRGGVAWGDYNNDGKLDLLSSWGKVYRQGLLAGASTLKGRPEARPTSLPFTKVFDGGGDQSPLAWADYDRDADLDAYASGRLYRNDGGDTFTDVTESAGLSDAGWLLASVWADYDSDGDPDLYLTCNGCANRLYQNNGDGTFTDVTAAAGVGDEGSGHGAAWGDYDNDGDLDLFVANNNDEYSVLYRNNGDSTFTDVSAAAGLHDWRGYATSANWLDYNLDGWLDVFVVNRGDYNRLYRNNGNGAFSDYAAATGVYDVRDRDGSTVGDYDNDGDPDIYVISGIWGWGEPNALYQNGIDKETNNLHWLKVKLVGVLSNVSGIGARVRLYSAGPLQTRQLAGSSGYMSQNALEALFGLGNSTSQVNLVVYWPSGVVDTRANISVDQTITIVESTPYLHDLAVVGVSPSGERPIDTPFQPLAMLRNLGQNTESGAPVSCWIEHNSTQVYSETLTTGAVPPAVWTTLLYPAFTPTDTGVYVLGCQSYLPADERPANDWLTGTITVTEQVADVWTKDNPDDDGDVPSGLDNWYGSPDLWVRNADDGGLVHQDPIESITNTVYVRLRNRGNTTVFTGTVSVYWIEPSLGTRCGDWAWIGDIPFSDLLPGEERIVKTFWTPTRSGHTCIQDVIDSPQDPYDRGLECSPQWVPWDNNVEWHNINILANPGGGMFGAMDIKTAEVNLVNIYAFPKDVDVIIDRMTFPLTGTISVLLPEDLFDRWLAYSGKWSEGIEVFTDTREIQITGAISATIGAVPMLADELATVGLRFEGPAGLEFEMAIRERIDGVTTGGVAYQWVIPDTTPPEVQNVSPSDGATNVSLSAPLVITFNEPVSPLSLNLQATPNPGGWSYVWSGDGAVVTANHNAFVETTRYTVTVTASDANANPMAAPYSWSFTTTDVTSPDVVSTSPTDGATGVLPEATVVITFSEAMSQPSLNLALTPDPGGWSFVWNDDSTVVTASHAAFSEQTLYAAQVTANDSTGNPMAAPYSWSFTTGDVTPPQVVAVSPLDNATGVALDASIVITFTEAISPVTLQLNLTPDPGGWSFVWSAGNTVVTATHADFAGDTLYTAEVIASDEAGNPLPAYDWSFTSRKEEFFIYLPYIRR